MRQREKIRPTIIGLSWHSCIRWLREKGTERSVTTSNLLYNFLRKIADVSVVDREKNTSFVEFIRPYDATSTRHKPTRQKSTRQILIKGVNSSKIKLVKIQLVKTRIRQNSRKERMTRQNSFPTIQCLCSVDGRNILKNHYKLSSL